MQVWSSHNTILNNQDWSDSVRSFMKARQDKDVIDGTSPLYIENEIELLRLIR